MGKCPVCGEKITHLGHHETRSFSSEVDLVDGKLTHSSEDEEVVDSVYYCPVCGMDVAETAEEAIQILKEGGE